MLQGYNIYKLSEFLIDILIVYNLIINTKVLL